MHKVKMHRATTKKITKEYRKKLTEELNSPDTDSTLNQTLNKIY